MSTITLATLLLTLNMLQSPTHSAVDFCHADPHQERQFPTTCAPGRHIVHVPKMDQNPFHALHDWIWGVTHYLLHCTQHRNVTLFVVSPTPVANISQCALSDFPPGTPRKSIPLWGLCVLHIVARSLAVDMEILFNDKRIWPPPVTVNAITTHRVGNFKTEIGEGQDGPCEYRTFLGIHPPHYGTDGLAVSAGHYRGLGWFGRECGSTGSLCNDSGLVLLPDEYKRAALRTVRQSVRTFFNVTSRAHSKTPPSLHVLLYDRSDTQRRQWINAHRIYDRLRRDKRLEVRFMHHVPISLSGQVNLYAWADVIVAPHGAAMANTAFMEDGGEIVEIWAFCDSDVAYNRYRPRDWTGWHAAALGLNLRYVQCYRAEHPYKTREQMIKGKNGAFTLGRHKVLELDVIKVLEPVIERKLNNKIGGDVDKGGIVKLMGVDRTLADVMH